ncbi:hypothetical protein [Pseudothauera rhizosphaerae]|uniref:Uncharacterized protein n=1 Tax=Pseudothauera rhizosphaerae TaxID=2565932 RepID=A0A4S4A9D2_9RHOO|nr:hypothetical protein [Pseudothauera rhizosphaerae]THF55194.1 hypothetical protein E6O51_21040 [Pseudothauera rhizosphaerae]
MVRKNIWHWFSGGTDAAVSLLWFAISYLIFAFLYILPSEILASVLEWLRFLDFIPVVKSIEHGGVFDVVLAQIHLCTLILLLPAAVFTYLKVLRDRFFHRSKGGNRFVLLAFVMPIVSLIMFFAPIGGGSVGRLLSSFSLGFPFLSALIVVSWAITFRGLLEVAGFVNSNEGD